LALPVRETAVSYFNVEKIDNIQLNMFEDIAKKERLVKAIDKVNDRWGNFVITPARMMGMDDIVLDRIAFGE
jgi:DNA polymerase-4